MKDRDVLVEELVLSNQAQLERNETLTVQNEDLRGEVNEAVSGTRLMNTFFLFLIMVLLSGVPPKWSFCLSHQVQ